MIEEIRNGIIEKICNYPKFCQYTNRGKSNYQNHQEGKFYVPIGINEIFISFLVHLVVLGPKSQKRS